MEQIVPMYLLLVIIIFNFLRLFYFSVILYIDTIKLISTLFNDDEQAIIILTKNGIQVNEKDAKIILELLYLIAKNYNESKERKKF